MYVLTLLKLIEVDKNWRISIHVVSVNCNASCLSHAPIIAWESILNALPELKYAQLKQSHSVMFQLSDYSAWL